MPQRKIDHIIDELTEIIEWSIETNCRAGIFAALYKRVTIEVKNKIDEGNYFDDNERMEKLDIVFADRYLEAVNQYRNNKAATKSWDAAFKAGENNQHIILQHLLLGINAHINLDLGIACAIVAPGNSITSMKNDFYKINKILFDLLDDVQERIGNLSPWMMIIDWLGKNHDEKIMGFSIERARDFSWMLAEQLAPLDTDLQPPFITLRDEKTALLANIFIKPGVILGFALKVIRLREENDCRRIIQYFL
jgi:hypothetical protein